MKPIEACRLWLLLGSTTASLILGAAVAAPPSDDGQSATKEPAADAETRDATVTIGDVAVAVDPKTGAVRPLTKAEAAKLALEMRKLFQPRELKRVAHPDGSLSAVVAPNVLEYALVRIEPDGTVSRTYADSEEEALKFMAGEKSEASAQPAEE
ncbi:MAG TPA: hypothetical protein VLC47_10875 [Burkholderiales bacterium]|nr:hypothetical protein [Burkholderiales bacterium]